MKKLLLISFCLLQFADAESQILPFNPFEYYSNTFSMFDLCKNYYNPAFTGLEEKPSIYLMSSYQYRKLYRPLADPSIPHPTPDGNRLQTLDLSTPVFIKGKQKFGAGLNYSRINQGYDVTNDLRLSLAWQHETGKGKILLGANADMLKEIADYQDVYPGVTTKQEVYTMNAGFGIAYYFSPRNFYAGLSTNHIVHHKLQLEEVGVFYKDYISIYYFISGIDIPLSKQFKLKPSVMAYSLHNPGINLSLALDFRERFNIGMTYNSLKECAGIRLGCKFKGLCINYAYEDYLSWIEASTRGIHSFGINYVFGQKALNQ